MTPDAIFPVANAVALVGWIVLAVAPHRRWSSLLASTIVPSLLSAVYVALIAAFWAGSEGGFSSLSDVAALFENRWLLLAGWTHYLAFDLLIGSWEARDASRRGIPHLMLVPSLILTFLFGPAGWLLYLGTRAIVKPSPTVRAA
jgi:hypothetical protein